MVVVFMVGKGLIVGFWLALISFGKGLLALIPDVSTVPADSVGD